MKTKKITIEIEHQLTPFNEKINKEMVETFTKTLMTFWGIKTKKLYKAKIK